MPTPEQRDIASSAVISRLAYTEPVQALSLLQDTKHSFDGATIETIFSRLAESDPAQATQIALRLSKSQDRAYALQSVATELTAKDPQVAMAWVEQLPAGPGQNAARQTFVNLMASTNPKAAADYVRGLQGLPDYIEGSLLENVATNWADADPKAATAWAQSLPPSDASREAMSITLTNWARIDPKGAVDFLNTLPPATQGRDQMVRKVVDQWGQDDPQAALAWAGGLEDDHARNIALAGAICQWGSVETVKAAGYVQAMPDSTAKETSVRFIADTWARDDPSAAAQWVANLPSPQRDNYSDVYGQLGGIWAQNNPVEASNWLERLPAGSNRDAAVFSFADTIASSDPGTAYAWAESIGDADSHQQAVFSALQKWMQTDPASATGAVQKSSLSGAQKNKLLQDTPEFPAAGGSQKIVSLAATPAKLRL